MGSEWGHIQRWFRNLRYESVDSTVRYAAKFVDSEHHAFLDAVHQTSWGHHYLAAVHKEKEERDNLESVQASVRQCPAAKTVIRTVTAWLFLLILSGIKAVQPRNVASGSGHLDLQKSGTTSISLKCR